MSWTAGRAAILTAAFVSLATPATSAPALTARSLIERHVKALGGARALKSVASVRLRGTVNGSGEFLWLTQAPSAYYLEVRSGAGHSVEAFNGKSAWREDEAGGARTLTGSEQARARATGTYRNDRFVGYRRDKTRVNLLGRESVEGRAAHVVEVTTAEGIRRKVLFDAQTFLILKEEQDREGGTEEILFGDYRAVDGITEPGRIRIRRGEETLELAVLETVHNASLEAGLFDFPRRDNAPLPDFAALFKEVLDNQEKLEKARADYTYTKTQNEIEMDDRGRVTKRLESTYEVFHVAGGPIEKLVGRNGRPLADDEARKEQQRVEKRVREQGEKARKAAEREKASGRDNDELTVSQILRVCRFVNPRRERFRGRDVLVYDFEPRAGEKPKNRAESWIQKLVGNVWIDEEARAIVRAEARTTDSIKMAGGLVLSVQRGSSFVFESELVRGEVWLPSYAEVNASARVLLVKGFKVNQTHRFSDYRRFEVDTSSEIQPPRK